MHIAHVVHPGTQRPCRPINILTILNTEDNPSLFVVIVLRSLYCDPFGFIASELISSLPLCRCLFLLVLLSCVWQISDYVCLVFVRSKWKSIVWSQAWGGCISIWDSLIYVSASSVYTSTTKIVEAWKGSVSYFEAHVVLYVLLGVWHKGCKGVPHLFLSLRGDMFYFHKCRLSWIYFS